MAWKQIKLTTLRAQAEEIAEWLSERGALAVTFVDARKQPVFEPAPGQTLLWQDVVAIGLFETDVDTQALSEQAQSLAAVSTIELEDLADQPWETLWMEHFEAMQFGPRLWICPSWQTPPDPDAVNVMLDPGLAFGSGTHETTALCLNWLEGQELLNTQLIDYGCGSGLLGIAALLLGAAAVTATDTDAQAITASRDNAARNNIPSERLHLLQVDPSHPPPLPRADIVVANILAEPLHLLAPHLAGYVRSGGHLGLSGILATQADEIAQRYQQWFVLEPHRYRGDWALVSGIKR